MLLSYAAYLIANINEEVFMQQHEGFEKHNGQGFPLVCKLKKNLYALTQSSKNWYLTIKGFLGDLVLFHLFKVSAS